MAALNHGPPIIGRRELAVEADGPDFAMNNLQGLVGLYHVGLLDLVSPLVNEVVREGRPRWRFCQFRTRLATIGDAAGDRIQARRGEILCRAPG